MPLKSALSIPEFLPLFEIGVGVSLDFLLDGVMTSIADGSCCRWKLLQMEVVADESCCRWKLLQMEVVADGSCTRGLWLQEGLGSRAKEGWKL
jgi:hypothetical protein